MNKQKLLRPRGSEVGVGPTHSLHSHVLLTEFKYHGEDGLTSGQEELYETISGSTFIHAYRGDFCAQGELKKN